MSKYTTQVRFICEHMAGLDDSTGFNDVSEVIDAAIPKIFDFDWPIYDETHRQELERKFLMHYYTREIGFETYGLWKLKLNTKLNEIMPYYNELYASVQYLKNPMDDVDYKRIIDGTENMRRDEDTESTQDIESNSSSLLYHTYSDTPQGALNGVRNDSYLTNASKDDSTNNGSSNTTGTFNTDEKRDTTRNTVETVKGKMYGASKAKMVTEYRKAILNIDMQIIDELGDLFMMIF